MEYRVEKVLKNKMVTENIYEMTVSGKFEGKPGQFYMLRAWEDEPLLSRPISIHSIDKDSITFLYAVVGKGTEILKDLKEGSDIKLLGPSGNGFPIEKIKGKVAIITGGIGIAPMYYVCEMLHEINMDVDLYSGFRDSVHTVDKFEKITKDIHISTETGIVGHKGYVTEIFNPENYDMVLCCGPEIMMKNVTSMCKEKDVPIYVSTEKKMACGVGACLVCTCKTKSGNKRSCKDGPVFLGEELY